MHIIPVEPYNILLIIIHWHVILNGKICLMDWASTAPNSYSELP